MQATLFRVVRPVDVVEPDAQWRSLEMCTERTVVRPFRLGEAEVAHAVFGDAEVMRFSAGEPPFDRRDRLAGTQSCPRCGHRVW